MDEPLTSLEYLARDFQKRYGVPCAVEARVDTGGHRGMKVFKWINDHWVVASDAFDLPPNASPPPLSKP